MKRVIALALAATVALSAASTADARQGCGVGFHRGPYGHCRRNLGQRVYAPAPRVLVVDRFYPGRGYWDGHRYWRHREHWHNHWRYRASSPVLVSILSPVRNGRAFSLVEGARTNVSFPPIADISA